MGIETVKIGSFWVEEYSNLLVVVKSLYGNSDGSNGVVYIVIDNQGNVSGRLSSEMGLFLSNKKRLYHTSDLQLKYNEGYLAGVMKMRGTERERVIREEAYDLGFMEALNTYGIELGGFELEPTSPYEFGAVCDETEYDFTEEIRKVLSGENKDVLRIPKGNKPNKETQEAMQEVLSKPKNPTKEVKHSHYRKSVEGLDYIDIYRVCRLFGVEDNSHCLHHAIKKLLMSGKRGSKSKIKDITEARDSLNSYLSDEELFEGLDK